MSIDRHEQINNRRRRLLKGLVTVPAASLLCALPGLSLGATGAGEKRFILIILRGAMDGLAAVAPYGDPALQGLRGSLTSPHDELHKLDSFFGLHPALNNLYSMYQAAELAVCHGVASPYRERSHFDGQNVLEIGMGEPDLSESGWLNRSVRFIEPGGIGGAEVSPAMAIGQAVPAVLQGEAGVGSWAPAILPLPSESTLSRIQQLYAEDDFLGARLQQALMTNDLVADDSMSGAGGRQQNFNVLIDAAAKFMSPKYGPAIAVVENSGWDTHANQGATQGQLARKFAELDSALARLKTGMASNWEHTVVAVVTEFGRTAAVNGTQGTDHGTASAAFVLGGGVNGGRIFGQWPGLASGNLYQGRDLAPTTDVRALFKTVLRQHMGIGEQTIESTVFPASSNAGYINGLI